VDSGYALATMAQRICEKICIYKNADIKGYKEARGRKKL
jgi:hypothetical protein